MFIQQFNVVISVLCCAVLLASCGEKPSRHRWNDASSAGAYSDNDSAYTQPHGYMCTSGGIMSSGCE